MSRYTKNHLKHVIIKVDFSNELPIDNNLPKEVLDTAQKAFPLFEPMPTTHSEIKISEDGAKVTNAEHGTNWIFYGLNKEKALSIVREGRHREKTSIAIDYSKYESFDILRDEFIPILYNFMGVFPESKIGRVGLRYINNIDLREKNPLNWNKYIHSNLLSSFRFVDDKERISRVFNDLEIKYDDMSIKFQYGMPNPDYPSPIKKKIFVLDYDVYYVGERDKSEVPDMMNKYHDKIISLFEGSIKEGLRNELNE